LNSQIIIFIKPTPNASTRADEIPDGERKLHSVLEILRKSDATVRLSGGSIVGKDMALSARSNCRLKSFQISLSIGSTNP